MDHLESLRITSVEKGYRELVSGRYDLEGRLPVNTSGGLLSRGHPTGATGWHRWGRWFYSLEAKPEKGRSEIAARSGQGCV